MSTEDKGQAAKGVEDGGREPERIREEIERTRAEMGETVAAVADKADVRKQAQAKADQLKEQAAARAKEAKSTATAKVQELGEKAKQAAPDSGGEGIQQAQQVARENPVPLALAGAFLAGLVVGRLSSR